MDRFDNKLRHKFQEAKTSDESWLEPASNTFSKIEKAIEEPKKKKRRFFLLFLGLFLLSSILLLTQFGSNSSEAHQQFSMLEENTSDSKNDSASAKTISSKEPLENYQAEQSNDAEIKYERQTVVLEEKPVQNTLNKTNVNTVSKTESSPTLFSQSTFISTSLENTLQQSDNQLSNNYPTAKSIRNEEKKQVQFAKKTS